jgi:hypothetical protein
MSSPERLEIWTLGKIMYLEKIQIVPLRERFAAFYGISVPLCERFATFYGISVPLCERFAAFYRISVPLGAETLPRK